MKKTYINGIKVSGISPSYKQMIDISEVFKTQDIHNNGDLQIKCFIKMQPHNARFKIQEILNCSFTQIRVKYHEK